MIQTYPHVLNGKNAVLSTVQIPNSTGGVSTYAGYVLRTAPTPVIKTYVPFEEVRTKYDPSKGRSFRELSKGGYILNSEYFVSRIETHNFVVPMQREFRDRSHPRSYNGGICYGHVSRDPECICSWTEQGDYAYWSTNYYTPVLAADYFDETLVEKAINKTQNAAYSQALSGYDLLTELAELNKTLSYLLSKVTSAADLMGKLRDSDPAAYKRGRGLTAKQMLRSGDKALRKLGSRWLEYRYAIMPLVYSFKDVSKLLNSSGNRYKSARSREIITPTSVSTTGFPAYCFYTKAVGTIEVRSHVKLRFDSVGLQNLFESSISFNPFATAWELVPFSFVVDWFLNIGNSITAQTSINFAQQTACTTSIKRNYSVTTWLKDQTWDLSQLPPYDDPCVKLPAEDYKFRRDVLLPLRVVSTESYDRKPFSRPTLDIGFDVSLNWKRFVDSLALAYRPTSKKLRSL